MGWEPSYLVSKLYNLINDEGENKRRERKKKKRGTIRLLACSILAQNG